MPERPRGRKAPPPEQPKPKEQDPQPYHRAAKYAGEQESETPYDTLQELIRVEPVDLSVMRIRYGDLMEFHVAVFGNRPEDAIVRRIEKTLESGEEVELPEVAWSLLRKRREEQQQLGSWVERHHFPRRRRTK